MRFAYPRRDEGVIVSSNDDDYPLPGEEEFDKFHAADEEFKDLLYIAQKDVKGPQSEQKQADARAAYNTLHEIYQRIQNEMVRVWQKKEPDTSQAGSLHEIYLKVRKDTKDYEFKDYQKKPRIQPSVCRTLHDLQFRAKLDIEALEEGGK
jgi:hypothetical protein